MPDLLLELRSEEIPARMQRKAAGDLRKLVTDGLVEAGLTYEAAREYWTPRRLALDVRGLTARSRDVREEKKGPSTKAPEAAVHGFLRSAGLASVAEAHVHTDPKKGDFYVAHLLRPGRAAEDIIAELIPTVIRAFPWPKSMRWGAASGPRGKRYGAIEGQGGETLRWVRPLQSILCTFGPETEEPVVVDFAVGGIRSGNLTYGHRFHAPQAITVRRFDDYMAKLEAAKVVLDAERRKAIILSDARNLAFASGLDLIEDEGLLEEVSGLVEWPVVGLGEFEADFLAIPAEVIRLTIRANQKCFVTRPSRLAAAFGENPQTEDEPAPQDEGGRATMTSEAGLDAALTNSVSGPLRIEPADRRESSSPLPYPEEQASTAAPGPASFDPGAGQESSSTVPHPEERAPTAAPGPASTPTGRASKDALANRFVLTANIEAADGGAEIARGNGKVVRARLSDALYFWNTDQADLPDLEALRPSAEKLDLDLAKPLDQRMARLDHLGVTFHAKLGTQGERVERIRRLAQEIAPLVGASLSVRDGENDGDWPISPLAGEMSGRTEGGAVPHTSQSSAATVSTRQHRNRSTLPLSALPGEASHGSRPSFEPPAGGEINQPGSAVSSSGGPDQLKTASSLASLAARAAVLAKADLATEIVGEFPELQGVMGRKYALRQGEHPSVAAAIEEHYKPQGPTDRVPTDPVSVAVALADKLDTLVGFWAIDEKPTGSKDPYALRRAALGVVRILVGNRIVFPLRDNLAKCLHELVGSGAGIFSAIWRAQDGGAFTTGLGSWKDVLDERFMGLHLGQSGRERSGADLIPDLLSFFHDRLKVYLRDQGARHDLIDAVLAGGGAGDWLISPLVGEMSGRTERGAVPQTSPFSSESAAANPQEQSPTLPPSALPGISPAGGEISELSTDSHVRRSADGRSPVRNDDLLEIVQKVEALGAFLDTENGKNLLAGTKRAVNILAAETKKGTTMAASVDQALLRLPAEQHLFNAVNEAEKEAGEAIQKQDFSGALRALSALREPVDSFFEDVLVNDQDRAVRANRLALLARIRTATGQVADFSKISG